MREIDYDFGPVSRINASAIGQPGERQFRLQVEAPAGSARLWLEKEQLYGLAVALRRLLVTTEQGPPAAPLPPPEDVSTQGETAVEFKVGQISLAHDGERDYFCIMTRNVTEGREEEEEVTFQCWASREQMEALSEEALKVCAAGRPLCPLCHDPMSPGPHMCPRTNGHVIL